MSLGPQTRGGAGMLDVRAFDLRKTHPNLFLTLVAMMAAHVAIGLGFIFTAEGHLQSTVYRVALDLLPLWAWGAVSILNGTTLLVGIFFLAYRWTQRAAVLGMFIAVLWVGNYLVTLAEGNDTLLAPLFLWAFFAVTHYFIATEPPLNPETTSYRDATRLQRALLNAIDDAVIAADAEERILYFNKPAERLWGYRREEVIGQLVETLMPQRYRAEHAAAYGKAFSGDARQIGIGFRPLYAQTKFGDEVPVGISLGRAEDMVVAVIRPWELELAQAWQHASVPGGRRVTDPPAPGENRSAEE